MTTMRYYLAFGSVSAALTGLLYLLLYDNTNWNPYLVWLAALGGATFVLYGLDKLLAKAGQARAPENLLHLLALLGGFAGGRTGMLAFHHKCNLRKHPAIWFFLVLATLGHAALAYFWLFRSG
jgi:uncharacterized membrane protein YsdA (DUF1294 family)